MTDPLAFGIGLLGTLVSLGIIVLLIALIVFMCGSQWSSIGWGTTFANALEAATKLVFTIGLVLLIVFVIMFGIGVSWAPLLERIYNGSS